MTLDEAIGHCYDVEKKCENKSCALDHKQLGIWLKELKDTKQHNLDIALKAYCKHDCEDFLDECPNRKKGNFCKNYRKFKEVLEQAMKGGEDA